jgi:oxygen-dependent protoporphyrinogen oxidase
MRMDANDIAARALSEFEACTGSRARVLAVEPERMPAWDVTWRSVQRVEIPEGLHFAANWWSRPGLPGRLAEAEQTARRLAGRSLVDAAPGAGE